MHNTSILEVAEPAIWAELSARVDLDAHTAEVLGPCKRRVHPSFYRDALPKLPDVLVRYPRREPEQAARQQRSRAEAVASLRHDLRVILHRAQRYALDGVVLGQQAWDPEHDAEAVRTLVRAELLYPEPSDDDAPYTGPYRLDVDLPDSPPVPYDLAEAAMDETDDLSEPGPGPYALLEDMACLAAALERDPVTLTQTGQVSIHDSRRLGTRLQAPALRDGARLDDDPRWGRALRGLRALRVISPDPIQRTLKLDLGVEDTLAGTTEDALDRLVHRLVDRDLHAAVPAIRAALKAAGEGAVDEMIFYELLTAQHRDVLFPGWSHDGHLVYPHLPGQVGRPYDEASFEQVEQPMLRAALRRMERFGLIRRAPGVFAATEDGRRWAAATDAPTPPIWVTGDLELIVPPQALTLWERFQIERLSTCLQRDTVDRYRLDRDALATWLSIHTVGDALDLLRRRCPGLPDAAVATLHAWAASATRITLISP